MQVDYEVNLRDKCPTAVPTQQGALQAFCYAHHKAHIEEYTTDNKQHYIEKGPQ